MRRKNHTLLHFLTALLLVGLLHACGMYNDGGGDQEHPPQTQILDVKVQPDTVAPGDTASFTCIIKDSTDKRFKFYWVVDTGEVIGAEKQNVGSNEYVSEGNYIKWVAPNKRDQYLLGVIVNNGTKDSVEVREGFLIVVK